MVSGFKPYLYNGVADILHPDPAFSGGITGCRKLAGYAAPMRVRIAPRIGPASMIRFFAGAEIGGAIQNFFKMENLNGEYCGYKGKMAAGSTPQIRKGLFALPEGPGLGLTSNPKWVNEHTAKGEPSWS